LLANDPEGDIEIIYPRPELSTNNPNNSSATVAQSSHHNRQETTRIRLLRSRHTIEISRHIPKAIGKAKIVGKWTKQVIPVLGHGFQIKVPDEEYVVLDQKAREALGVLYRFLKVCDAVEETRIARCLPVDEARQAIPPSAQNNAPMRGIDQRDDCISPSAKRHVEDEMSCPTPQPSRPTSSHRGPSVRTSDDSASTTTSLRATIHASTSSIFPFGNVPVRPRPLKFSRVSSYTSNCTGLTVTAIDSKPS
jgi:hypothetical protein